VIASSCLYEGRVRHRRFAPAGHAFTFPLFMAYLDLDELDRVFRRRLLWSTRLPNVAWFRRADYLGDRRVPLDAAVRDRVERETGARPEGPVRVLTHLRYLGYCFNPVSFYYCFDPDDRHVETIVAEITNTPWKERHAYVLDRVHNLGHARPGAAKRFVFGKSFHVSPFMPMEQRYDWRFGEPGERLGVHMRNHEEDGRVFDATLSLRRVEMSSASMARALVRYPAMTAQVIAAIHWHALRLWIKRVPVHPHPRTRRLRSEDPAMEATP
jgi:DUF1365 family protein